MKPFDEIQNDAMSVIFPHPDFSGGLAIDNSKHSKATLFIEKQGGRFQY